MRGSIKMRDETKVDYYANLNIDYLQDKDSNDSGDEFQELNMGVENAGGDDYFVISTKRWAFNNIDDFIKLLNHFKEIYKKINKNEI